MKKAIYSSILFLIITTLLYTLNSFAGPTVITDNRIHDLTITPVLGRGYSISTNTFQSSCLDSVNVTEPSYDFTYLFNSIELEGEGSGELESKIDVKSFSESFRNELLKRITITPKDREGVTETYFKHNIYVEINLNSYYASLDESQAQLSSSAAALLTSNDILGFFSSCGSYYVRSIGRNAKFVAIFTYKTKDRTPDEDFEEDLEAEINGFGNTLEQKIGSDITDSAIVALGGLPGRDFRKRASSRKLTITVAAFGLGKNDNATLISYDISTFKASIADAFISMQNPRTGKVSSIEVVPWVENTDFQASIKLEEDTEVLEESSDNEAQQNQSPRKLLLYEKNNILNQNAEFFAEIERMDRMMLNRYYKAKICRQYINENWMSNGALKLEYRNKQVLNNKVGDTYPLSGLNKLVTERKIQQLLATENNFLYGNGSSDKGSSGCMRDIMRMGIFKVSHRYIKSCDNVIKKLVDVENKIIDNYCMPMLAK
ncbi:MAG: hypothetical protein GY786_03845 [Proteobacteria bacterium]|nr:hypothetical protein [Pseudomonadota bacterium]